MNKPRAAVVGSGFGGLALAVRLQAAGIPTTLVEKRDRPGGRAYVYQRRGLHLRRRPDRDHRPRLPEGGVRGRRGASIEDYVTLVPVSPFYRLFWEDGYRFDYSNDFESTFEQIRRQEPRGRRGVRGLPRRTPRRCSPRATRGSPTFRSSTGGAWCASRRSSCASKPIARSTRWCRGSYATPQLRQTFSFHSLLVGGNPFTASSIYTLIHFLERSGGVWFPARRHGRAGRRPGTPLPRARRAGALGLRGHGDPDP